MSVMDNVDEVADEQFWRDAAPILGGLLAAEMITPYVAGTTVPGAGYTLSSNGESQAVAGLLAALGAQYAPLGQKRMLQLGAAAATLQGVAERTGVRSMLPSAGGGN
jgi:hypothetical protein